MKSARSFSILALVALVAGCAAHGARVSNTASSEDGSALPAARELNGTWRGNYWQLGMVLYDDDANCTVRIMDSATFTSNCTRSAVGTNNIAKSSTWSGRVVTKGNHVILKDDRGMWPNIVLKRSGNTTLYGTTLDPLTGATVEMELEHVPNTAAGIGGDSFARG
jgi:hypothetical protein